MEVDSGIQSRDPNQLSRKEAQNSSVSPDVSFEAFLSNTDAEHIKVVKTDENTYKILEGANKEGLAEAKELEAKGTDITAGIIPHLAPRVPYIVEIGPSFTTTPADTVKNIQKIAEIITYQVSNIPQDGAYVFSIKDLNIELVMQKTGANLSINLTSEDKELIKSIKEHKDTLMARVKEVTDRQVINIAFEDQLFSSSGRDQQQKRQQPSQEFSDQEDDEES